MIKRQAIHTGTITTVEEKVLKKGKNVLYLILKPKNIEDQIIEDINEEMEKRFKNCIEKIIPKIKNVEFDDNENSLKYIMISGLIKVLNEMLKEIKMTLSYNDQMLIEKEIKLDENHEKREIFPNYNNSNKNLKNNEIYLFIAITSIIKVASFS